MAVFAKHITAGATAASVTLTRGGKWIVVVNPQATQIAYFTVGNAAAGPGGVTTAVAAADDTYPAAAGGIPTRVPSVGVQAVVSVIASGADTPVSVYTVDY